VKLVVVRWWWPGWQSDCFKVGVESGPGRFFLAVLRPAGVIQAHGSRRIKQYCESGRGRCKQRLEVGSVNNWHAGDVVVWDNCSTLHLRDGFDESARRIMHRTQMLGPLTV